MIFVYTCSGKSTRQRFYVVTAGESAQFTNIPFEINGYFGVVMQTRPPMGSRNITIPAGSVIIFNNIFIDQCPPDRDWRLCQHSVLTPHNPRENIRIRFYSQYYSAVNQPPSRYSFSDCVATHPLWGTGSIHGYNPLREDTERTLEVRQIITFPDHKY